LLDPRLLAGTDAHLHAGRPHQRPGRPHYRPGQRAAAASAAPARPAVARRPAPRNRRSQPREVTGTMRIVLLTPARRFIANRFGVGYQLPLGLVFVGGPLVDAGHT